MIKEKYLNEIKDKVNQFIPGDKTGVFVFGSSLGKEHFGDVDIGVQGEVDERALIKLKEEFEESNLPYFVEVINFNNVTDKFKNNVFNNKILWIKRLS